MRSIKEDREAFEEAISNMTLTASPYFKDYVFYMHLISNCRVIFNTMLPAAREFVLNTTIINYISILLK